MIRLSAGGRVCCWKRGREVHALPGCPRGDVGRESGDSEGKVRREFVIEVRGFEALALRWRGVVVSGVCGV